MFYIIATHFSQDYHFLNVFRYITFRTGGALLTSLIIGFWLGPKIIRWLKTVQKNGQPIRENGPESHLLTKQGTPTMGGLIILIGITVGTLLWGNLYNPYILICLFSTLSLGFLGGLDDYMKLKHNNHKGISGKAKLLFQIGIGVIVGIEIMKHMPEHLNTHLTVPFFKNLLIDLGYFYIPFVIVVITGASNAVNLTDGLDGLAIGPSIICALCFAIIAYLVGNTIFANYLQIHHIPQSGEVAVFCGSLIGAGLGFLWYNAPPAKVFMGDTGSLALGGGIGAISIITKHEIVLAIIGGLFVLEALSVMIQVLYFKISGGKRIFLMAPVHHHFEKKGWSEPTIVIRFWIIAIIFALIGLSTLKLR
tara:strand:+ start:20406 stop:21497 length:1092 start_codon:yes stop_codon:yes gene_type:complete